LIIPVLASSRGFLQGLQNFKSYGVSLGLEGMSKLIFGVLFVLIGWKVSGAIVGVILSYLLAVVFGHCVLKSNLKGDKKTFVNKEIYHYTIPVFFTVLFFTAFYSIDLLLVKHFFSAIDAGKYAVVSLIGKIVFFASFSVVQVMYPKVIELSGNNGAHKNVLYKSLLIILLMVIPILLVYHFFGDYVVNILFGESYLSIVPLIVPYGLFMLFVSISKMFSLYLLSFKKYGFLYLFSLFLLFEIMLIFLFHESLTQIVNMLMVLGLLFTVLTSFLVVRFKEK
jgi:O-antigen/teichoic acid export membrane protein